MALPKQYNIFIDASVLESDNFAYSNVRSEKYKKLHSLAAEGIVKLLVPSIANNEIERRIKKNVASAHTILRQFHKNKEAQILRNLTSEPWNSLFSKFTPESHQSELLTQWGNFFKEMNGELLANSDIDIDAILKKYFNVEPPFDSQKPKEFPDAFILDILDKWSVRHGIEIFCVSNDSAFHKVQTNGHLVHLRSVSEFLDKIASQESVLPGVLDEIVEKEWDYIHDSIKSQFENLAFVSPIWDGEIEDVQLEDIELIDQNIISAEFKECIVEIDTRIQFSATVHYPDPLHTAYDKESDKTYYFEWKNEPVERSEIMTAHLCLVFSDHTYAEYEIESIELIGADIEVLTDDEEDAKSQYK